jgi:hypothetical protein
MRQNYQRQTARCCTADSFSIHSRSMTHPKKLDLPFNFDNPGSGEITEADLPGVAEKAAKEPAARKPIHCSYAGGVDCGG